jgi:hypothetical protein
VIVGAGATLLGVAVYDFCRPIDIRGSATFYPYWYPGALGQEGAEELLRIQREKTEKMLRIQREQGEEMLRIQKEQAKGMGTIAISAAAIVVAAPVAVVVLMKALGK